MGWFDNEKDEKARMPERPRPTPASSAERSSARGNGDSTLGERVHVNGTIVCEEGLRVLGTIEGEIQAREELTVATGAKVRALIQGRRVVVEGTVEGDIRASEVVLLGPTASLVGNISTPSLHIQEGAFFKGKVEMRAADRSADRSTTKGASPDRTKGAAGVTGDGGGKTKEAGDKGKEGADKGKEATQKGLPGTSVEPAAASSGSSKEADKEGGATAKSGSRGAAAGPSGN